MLIEPKIITTDSQLNLVCHRFHSSLLRI